MNPQPLELSTQRTYALISAQYEHHYSRRENGKKITNFHTAHLTILKNGHESKGEEENSSPRCTA